MITINNKQYRNLEEQVQFDNERINRIIEGDELLGRLGIKVVGRVDTAAEIPTPTNYPGEYGDAYLVGTEPPYDYYIFTRPFEGQLSNQWFNLGKFPVAGPAGKDGEQGPMGPTGQRGSQWFSGSGQPTTTSGYLVGDYYINVGTGNIWHLHNIENVPTWLMEGNIRGPQGIQGEQGIQGPRGEQGETGATGPAGPIGPLVDIVGEATEEQVLDINPYDVPRQTAYLVQKNNVKHVYIIVGEDDNLDWYDAGIFASGTIVTESGLPIETFNADTKLNVQPGNNKVYVNDFSGRHGTVTYDDDAIGSAIVQRTITGQVVVPAEPTNNTHAASKAYADKKFPLPTNWPANNAVPFVAGGKQGTVSYLGLTAEPEGNKLVQRDAAGDLKVRSFVSTSSNVAIGASQVYGLVNANKARIGGETIPANQSIETIEPTECGFFVVVGPTRIQYTMNNSATTIESEYHLILRYYEESSSIYRTVHIYFQAPSLSDLTVIKRIDGQITSNMTITNLQTSGGARVIRMPMSSPLPQ